MPGPDDVILWAGAISATVAALYALAKVGKAAVNGFWRTFKRAVAEANEPLSIKVQDLREYTEYHLGPNGHTVPIHTRLGALEAAHGLETPPASQTPPIAP